MPQRKRTIKRPKQKSQTINQTSNSQKPKNFQVTVYYKVTSATIGQAAATQRHIQSKIKTAIFNDIEETKDGFVFAVKNSYPATVAGNITATMLKQHIENTSPSAYKVIVAKA